MLHTNPMVRRVHNLLFRRPTIEHPILRGRGIFWISRLGVMPEAIPLTRLLYSTSVLGQSLPQLSHHEKAKHTRVHRISIVETSTPATSSRSIKRDDLMSAFLSSELGEFELGHVPAETDALTCFDLWSCGCRYDGWCEEREKTWCLSGRTSDVDRVTSAKRWIGTFALESWRWRADPDAFRVGEFGEGDWVNADIIASIFWEFTRSQVWRQDLRSCHN